MKRRPTPAPAVPSADCHSAGETADAETLRPGGIRTADALSDAGADEAGEEDFLQPQGPSDVARRVRKLQSSVLEAAAKRKRLPQPLFWSLFHNELEEIRRSKERKRLLSKLV